MRFSPQFLDELRARLPVSEVVGRRVKLRKAGREWKGLSPFNKEKTPSFFVNDQKQAWFDFSSGKNGSIFDFVMLTEGLSFPEAVERLAAQAGMPLPQVSHAEEAREERRNVGATGWWTPIDVHHRHAVGFELPREHLEPEVDDTERLVEHADGAHASSRRGASPGSRTSAAKRAACAVDGSTSTPAASSIAT